MGLVRYHGWYELRTPYVARSTRDGQLVRKAASHVHDIGHESERSELVGELAAEEEEVGIGGIGRLEIIECDFVGDPFILDSGENFRAEGRILGLIHLVWRRGPKLFHGVKNGIVLVLVIASAMVFVDSLQ